MGWWVIEDSQMLGLLERCHSGEDPNMVFLEAYSNAEHEQADEEDLEYGSDLHVSYPDEDD